MILYLCFGIFFCFSVFLFFYLFKISVLDFLKKGYNSEF
jgi:hypothetical protein